MSAEPENGQSSISVPTEFWAGHIVLSGISGWALLTAPQSARFALGSFGITLGQSLCGVFQFGQPGASKQKRDIFVNATLFAQAVTLPLITADLYKLNQFPDKWIAIHLATALLPLASKAFLSDESQTCDYISSVVNVGTLAYLITKSESCDYVKGLTVLTALHNFILRPLSESYNIPRIEIFTYGLIFTTIFATLCLDGK